MTWVRPIATIGTTKTWSSYRAHVGEVTTPAVAGFRWAARVPAGSADRDRTDCRLAVQRYSALVADARPDEAPTWQVGLSVSRVSRLIALGELGSVEEERHGPYAPLCAIYATIPHHLRARYLS